MNIECPPGEPAGQVEQSLSIFKPSYIIKNNRDEDVYVVEGPGHLCSCFTTCCHCCASRDILFRIVDLKTDKQVGLVLARVPGL